MNTGADVEQRCGHIKAHPGIGYWIGVLATLIKKVLNVILCNISDICMDWVHGMLLEERASSTRRTVRARKGARIRDKVLCCEVI